MAATTIWHEDGSVLLSSDLPTLVVDTITSSNGVPNNNNENGRSWEQDKKLEVMHSLDDINFKTITFRPINQIRGVKHTPPALTIYHPVTQEIMFTTSKIPLNIVDVVYATEWDAVEKQIIIPDGKKYGILYGASTVASAITVLNQGWGEYYVRERRRAIDPIFSQNSIKFKLTDTVEAYWTDYMPSSFDVFVRVEAYIVDLTFIV